MLGNIIDKLLNRYYPWEYSESVFDIDYRKLAADGFKAVIFDIDNTLVHHGDDSTPEIDRLFEEIHSAGLKTLLLTNNDEERVLRFIRNIDTLYVCDAEKPDTAGYKKALGLLEVTADQAVCAGDQLFTDVLGANKAGIPSVLIHYIYIPGVTKIGKKRYIEKLIMWFWSRSKRYSHCLGSIIKKENQNVLE